jgi:hypothetical protein
MEWVRRATNDEAELTKWWGMWSNANIGIATGHRSGIVVLDVDEKSGGVATLKALNEAYGTQMAGVIAKTGGGGFHVYFKHPGGYWPNTQGSPTMPSPIGQGLDFRGDGGYVAAPGSEHLSGQLYRWVKDCGPGSELAEMPEWLKSKLVKKTSSSVVLPTDEKALVLEGNRHNTLRAWACGMRAKGMSAGAIRAGVIKATYMSSVGSRVLPTLMKGELADRIRTDAHEYGATTKRPRDIAYLDLPALRYFAKVGNIDRLVLTHMDVIYDDEPVKVCVGYKLGKATVGYRPDQEFLNTVEPIYKELKPWNAEKLHAAKTRAELPKEAKVFLEMIEKEIGVPVLMITTGPQRDQGILFEEVK